MAAHQAIESASVRGLKSDGAPCEGRETERRGAASERAGIVKGVGADVRDHREAVRRAGRRPRVVERQPLGRVSEWNSPVVPVMNTVRMPLAARKAA